MVLTVSPFNTLLPLHHSYSLFGVAIFTFSDVKEWTVSPTTSPTALNFPGVWGEWVWCVEFVSPEKTDGSPNLGSLWICDSIWKGGFGGCGCVKMRSHCSRRPPIQCDWMTEKKKRKIGTGGGGRRLEQ
jgi:hypothetical protein